MRRQDAVGGEHNAKRNTISGKINKSIITILVPCMVVLIVVSCLMAASAVRNLNDSVLEAQADYAVDQVDNFFKNKLTAVGMFQTNTRTQMYFEGMPTATGENYYDVDSMVTLLSNTFKTMSPEGVQAVWAAGLENGNYLANTGEISPVGYDTVDWDDRILSGKKPVVTEPYLDSLSGNMVISTVTPVFSQKNADEVIGFVGFDVYENKLAEELADIKIEIGRAHV